MTGWSLEQFYFLSLKPSESLLVCVFAGIICIILLLYVLELKIIFISIDEGLLPND